MSLAVIILIAGGLLAAAFTAWACAATGKAFDKHLGMPDDEQDDQEHA